MSLQTVLSMLRVQSEQIEQLTMRVNQIEQINGNNNNNNKKNNNSATSSTIRSTNAITSTLNNIQREQRRMQTLLSAVERQSYKASDLQDDVEILKKNDSSHRYDLRLLKTSVGELMSSDRSYSLEVEQSVSHAKQLLQQAFGEHRSYLTREICETVQQKVLALVDYKLQSHLETTSTEAARAANNIINRDRESEAYYINTTQRRQTDDLNTSIPRQNQNETSFRSNASSSRMNTTKMTSQNGIDPFLIPSSRAQESTHELEEEFDADKVELEMDLLRLEERIKAAQHSANTRY